MSLGTGRCMKGRENEKMSNSTSLREKLTKVVASATDTEGKWMMNDEDGWMVGWLDIFMYM